MNYGKFFRLNQRVSKIEEGISIYDYIDLPAYFESSESNKMSPKYPISVTFDDYSVIFRVHYSCYKSEPVNDGDLTTPKRRNIEYLYDESAFRSNTIAHIRHMEEVILELPFSTGSADNLYQIIKEIYITRYPILNRDENDEIDTNFIYELIQKRYNDAYDRYESSLEFELYQNLRRNYDNDSSYSRLWLMGLARNNNYNLFDTSKNPDITTAEVKGFLRKLLLDFMFDLKHSDVFQTSKYYQTMYSGLMDNFFFSSLIHKCEYYFYRDLVVDLVKRKSVDKDQITDHLYTFYAKALIDAETLWIHDIMNPLSEKYFEHYYSQDILNTSTSSYFKKVIAKVGWGKFSFRRWNSWFAAPEEEMRRIYFTMRENTGSQEFHICNTETVNGYLTTNHKKLDKSHILRTNSNKTEVSQWFLRRYAFSDVLHLHSLKYVTIPLYLTILILLGCLFILPQFVTQQFWNDYWHVPIIYILLWCLIAYIFYLWSKKWVAKGKENENILFAVRRKMLKQRTIAVGLTVISSLSILFLINWGSNNCPITSDMMGEVSPRGISLKIGVIMAQIITVTGIGYLFYKLIYPVHWLSNMHVFFPRLVASIAAAWLTLAAGEDLFVAFLDSIVSWSTSIWLGVIVFIFVMYEINKMLPLEETYVKVNRSLGIMAISYVISLIIGLCVINFMGERMLESGGELSNFYSNYVDTNTIKQVENKRYFLVREKNDNSPAINSSSSPEIMLNELQNVHVITEGSSTTERGYNHPIATSWELSGKTEGEKAEFFILREFLIQFSFIAMFIGIFIQMIFEEKGITEV